MMPGTRLSSVFSMMPEPSRAMSEEDTVLTPPGTFSIAISLPPTGDILTSVCAVVAAAGSLGAGGRGAAAVAFFFAAGFFVATFGAGLGAFCMTSISGRLSAGDGSLGAGAADCGSVPPAGGDVGRLLCGNSGGQMEAAGNAASK